MPPEELIKVLQSHQLWLDSDGEEGERATFEGVNFGAAIDLRGADLRKAILNRARFKKSNLTETNFQGAELRRADFAAASLRGANLREADLQNATLENAEFLLTSQLAGADVAGAKLPEAIAGFEGLKTVAESTSSARKLFIAMLSGCLYSWLTIGTTKDAALLTNSASSPLPIIGTALPIVGFYLVAPVVLLALYFYFHLNMQRLWEVLADLPAVFPDGRSLDKRAGPWLLNGLVSAHFVRLRGGRPSLSRVQQSLSILLAWWVVPITLFVFWGRFLMRHDWLGTGLHIGLVAVATGFGWMSYRLACNTLRGTSRTPYLWTQMWKDVRSYKRATGIVGTCVIGFIFYCISLGGIEGIESYKKGTGVVVSAPERSVAVLPFDNLSSERENAYFSDGVQDEILTQLSKIADLKVISRTSAMQFQSGSRNLREIARMLDVSHLVEGRVQSSGDRRLLSINLLDARTDRHIWAARYDRASADLLALQTEMAKDIAAELNGAISSEEPIVEESRTANRSHLRVLVPHALKAIGFSPFANLIQIDVSTKPASWTGKIEEYTLVKGARLAEARMQFANVRSAFLVNADLFQANLDGANLENTNLQHAKLLRANLSNIFAPYVNFSGANLENAHLENADLENAHFENANLGNANLSEADLFGADLSNAVMSKAKLMDAHLESANLSNANLLQANLENATLWKAKLVGTRLEGANLAKADLLQANLENADLSKANLSNANLSNANLSNANLFRVNLTNATLDRAILAHTDLSQVEGLTRNQLEKAITDEKTLLPENLLP